MKLKGDTLFGNSNKKTFRVVKISNGYTVTILTGDILKEPESMVAADAKAVLKIINDNMPK